MRINTSACFSTLKSLNIWFATVNLRETLGEGHGANYDLLPNLQYLVVRKVEGMRSISELAAHLGLTFSKLQRLRVYFCSEMKYVLSVGHHLNLENLEYIEISGCYELEVVFEYVAVAHPQGHCGGVVPNLKEINLDGLPELRTLCKSDKVETWPSLEQVAVRSCDKLRKLPISGQNNSITEIHGETSWWNKLEWDDPSTNTSLQHLFRP